MWTEENNNKTPQSKFIQTERAVGAGDLAMSSLHSENSELKRETTRLADQLAAAVGDATSARNELAIAKEDMQKEFTSLWLAVQQLNSLDAAKERALQDLISDRDKAVRERNEAIEKLNIMQKEYAELQSELEAIDSDLLRAADMEGITIEKLDLGSNRRSKQESPINNKRTNGYDQRPQSYPEPVARTPHQPVRESARKPTTQKRAVGGSRSPMLNDTATEQGLERQLIELSQFLEHDKFKSSSQLHKERMRSFPRSTTPRR